MNFATLYILVPLAGTIAALAQLTALRRGPFGAILRRLGADVAEYQAVATMLWVVVVGLMLLAAGAFLFPAQTKSIALWGILFFAAGPSLVATVCKALRRNAP